MSGQKPVIYTSLSPALLNLYDVSQSIVVVIDILRRLYYRNALHNGAKSVIPVDSVSGVLNWGKQIEGITAGERDGKDCRGT